LKADDDDDEVDESSKSELKVDENVDENTQAVDDGESCQPTVENEGVLEQPIKEED
jgi:hypothetical protein